MDTQYVFEWIEETTSTQDVARRLFAGRTVVVGAGFQTQGRGRRGSVWETAPRGLAVSICWNPGWDPATFGTLPLVAGLAATDVLPARLKWPNDLVLENGDKLGGILAESSGSLVTIGLGLNLFWPDAPDGYGAAFSEDPGPGSELAREFADRLLERTRWGSDGWGREDYVARCVTLGRDVTWNPSGAGQAVDIGSGGELVVETTGGRRTLVTGEAWQVRSQ